jgi:hypothetical protein
MGARQGNAKQEVEDRIKEFFDDHKDFESQWARNVLHNVSEFLPFVFKFDAVRHGLEQLYTESGVQCPADWDWATDWTSADEHLPIATLRQLPIFRLALALNAYAYYGLKLMTEPGDPQGLDGFLADFQERTALLSPVYALFPYEWGGRSMEQTITAALARQKLDHPELGGITPEELAALVKLPRKNIVNLAPKKGGVLKTDAQGLITVESARLWLSTRRNFRPSIWQQQDDIRIEAPSLEPLQMEDPVFVPVASDGTWFSPNDLNNRDNSYHVANGDHEEKYQNYWTALEFLSHSQFPRWRYYDAARRWRTKMGAGDDWLRKSRMEIEKLLQASRAQAPTSQATEANAKP